MKRKPELDVCPKCGADALKPYELDPGYWDICCSRIACDYKIRDRVTKEQLTRTWNLILRKKNIK